MIDFYLKKGDRLPVFAAELLDADDNTVDISNTTVYFNYKLRYPGSTGVSRTMDIVNPVSGLVQYAWTSGDTSTPGLYEGEIIAEFTGGYQMSFPPGASILFQVIEDIGV